MKKTNLEVEHAHRYANLDSKVYLMMPNFANDYNVPDSVKDRFMSHNLMKEEAFSKSPIKRITGVKHVQFEGTEIMYSIYEVLREDNQKQYFCDNDLLSVNPSDLIPLGRRMKMKMNEGKHPQDKVAFYRIIRCMENFVKHRRQTDFQVGLDLGLSYLSISAPNVHRDKIEMFPVGKILTVPEDGVVFKRPNQKCFFRVSEAHKYSAEVIELIKGFVSLQKDEGSVSQEDRIVALRIFNKLDSLQKIRKITELFHKIINFKQDAPF